MEAAERIALYSIAVNFRLVICKYGLAVFSGSLDLRADAIHSCADIVSAASIRLEGLGGPGYFATLRRLVAVKMTGKAPDLVL
jgi:hypothetical protein